MFKTKQLSVSNIPSLQDTRFSYFGRIRGPEIQDAGANLYPFQNFAQAWGSEKNN